MPPSASRQSASSEGWCRCRRSRPDPHRDTHAAAPRRTAQKAEASASQPKGEGKKFAKAAEAKARARQAAEDRAAVAAAGGDGFEIQGLNDADGGAAFAIASFLANEQQKDDPIEKFLREVGRGTAQGR